MPTLAGCCRRGDLHRLACAIALTSHVFGAHVAAQSPGSDSVPPAVHWEAYAFDDRRDVLVRFGGTSGWSNGQPVYDESTWEWRGAAWKQVRAGSVPPSRHAHGMAYHPDLGEVFLAGGLRVENGMERSLCDSWRYNGTDWSRTVDGPCGSAGTSLVFDSARRVMLWLDEGASTSTDSTKRLRLWSWTPSRWIPLDATGPRNAYQPRAAFDDRRQVLVVLVFDGPDEGVWEWNGRAWSHIDARGPSARGAFGFAYDSRSERVLLTGGRADADDVFLSDTWTWDGRQWARLPLGGEPPPRSHATLLLDTRRARLIYIGGSSDQPGRTGTFTFDSSGWRPLAEQEWPRVAVQSSAVLPALHGESVAFDSVAGNLVVFGGRASTGLFEGTWARNSIAWKRLVDAAGGPPHRSGHAMGFNPASGEMFLFGGMTSQPLTFFCDTWILRGAEWRRVAESPCLDGRGRNASLVYDAASRAMLLVSGPAIANESPAPLELWRWDGRAWQPIDRSGPRRLGFGAVAYDQARSSLVVPILFGGPDSGVWEWRGGSWRHIKADGPSIRQTFSLAYDSVRQKIVLVGGQGSTHGPYLDDVWTWDGVRWDRVDIEGDGLGGRAGGTLVDRGNGTLAYFGGYDERGPLAELWELTGSSWRVDTPNRTSSASCVDEIIGPRTNAAMTYHARMRRVLLFGGEAADPSNPFPRTLFAWDGERWRCVATGGPPGRSSAELVYDEAHDRLVLFGGRDRDPDGRSRILTDTWTWDGETWKMLDPAPLPSRIHAAVGYHPARRSVLLYGGIGRDGAWLSDVWELVGDRWQLSSLPPPGPGEPTTMMTTPASATLLLMVDDERCGERQRARLVEVLRDEWRVVDVDGPCVRLASPGPAEWTSAGYLLFAGWEGADAAAPAKSWIRNGDGWVEIERPPSRRRGANTAYDIDRGVVVLFGGDNESGILGDTWEWSDGGWRRSPPA